VAAADGCRLLLDLAVLRPRVAAAAAVGVVQLDCTAAVHWVIQGTQLDAVALHHCRCCYRVRVQQRSCCCSLVFAAAVSCRVLGALNHCWVLWFLQETAAGMEPSCCLSGLATR
jgi:hypothetical protein